MHRVFLVKSLDVLYIVLEKETMYFRAITGGDCLLHSSKQSYASSCDGCRNGRERNQTRRERATLDGR